MASDKNEVVIDLSPALRVYKDGTVERLFDFPRVPPSPEDPKTGVSSKDISISPEVLARVFLPRVKSQDQKLPIVVYYHGGGFCLESAFSVTNHGFVNTLASEAGALVVSVEYRQAPEHLMPAGYEDSWTALQWVASHADHSTDTEKDPWLINHGNLDRLFLAGDSAGGNIVHNLALRASTESILCGVKIVGAILAHSYFWGSKPVGSMSIEDHEQTIMYKLWPFVYPSAPGGLDNPQINPFAEGAPSLARLQCSKMFICTAEQDQHRETILYYAEAVKKSGWKGEIELVDAKGVNHCYQIYEPHTETARDLIKRLASFIMH